MATSQLNYICNVEDIQHIKRLDDQVFLIRKKGEQHSATYKQVGMYSVKVKLPKRIGFSKNN